MIEILKIIRLIKRKGFSGFLAILYRGFSSIETFRDLFLGLMINGIYGIFNETRVIPFIITIVSFFAIMIYNNILRRQK